MTGPTTTAPRGAPVAHDAAAGAIEDLNVRSIASLAAPHEIKRDLAMSETALQTVTAGRRDVQNILDGTDRRFLVVVGPCSIHDEKAAIEYAGRLAELAKRYAEQMLLVMRVYFEKPRTTVGWKGLINDPNLDGSFDIDAGLRKARRILLAINEMGLPAGTELLDPVTPQYIADLISWTALGARTTESQTHRQMASGLSMPVGYKNSTDGNLQIAVDAIQSARQPHAFLGMDADGRTAVVHTRGNAHGHLILRGGTHGPNYDPVSVAEAQRLLASASLREGLMIDCSHANSGKKFKNQAFVWQSVLFQRTGGNSAVIGAMIESNLVEGAQKLAAAPAGLAYGQSITDQCIGWDETESLLAQGAQMLREQQAV